MDVAKFVDNVDKLAKANAAGGTYLANDGLLRCAKCGGKRQTRVEFMGRERVVHCICDCQAAEMERQKHAAEIAEQQKRIALLRKRGFNNDDIAQWTFANDNGSNEKIIKVMQNYVANFAEFKKKGKGLLLYGDVGTGKTFAAACVANALIDKGVPCYMTNFNRVSNALMSTFDGKQVYLDDLNKFDLLVLDDLGAERKTEYMQEVVYSVIDARYRAGLPLIVTTNLSLQELKNPQNITEARCYDRILERCHPVEVAGRSQRRKKIVEEYEQTKLILGI